MNQRAAGTGDAIQLRVGGYVMAGGESTRFGRDKAMAELGGKTVLARMCEMVRDSVGSVTVVAPPARYSNLAVPVLNDRWPGDGPFGGIVTALLASAEVSGPVKWNLMVSCDMPFLSSDWLRFMTLYALKSEAQVVVPRSKSGLEPLCACWRTEAAATLKAAFERGVRKVTDGIALLRAEILDEADWKRFDSAGRLFWNMNTMADYEEARRILEAEQQKK
jgi:molybdenum cofactor guanylyltransferase